MCARACMRVYARMIEGNRTHDQDRHKTGTPTEHTTTGKAGKPEYICMIAGTEKKYKKKLRKIWKCKKTAVSLLP